jgi:SAM-dependent methyltransferase
VPNVLDRDIFAIPRTIDDPAVCYFYHTMEIPTHGLVQGEWDLRPGVDNYLGGVDFKGKRVLEIGTASGFLCFHMESRGAEVVAYDLSEDQAWDIVPYQGADIAQAVMDYKAHIRKLNNGYWFAHKRFNSKAQVAYGSVYAIPEQIGPVDISVFGAVLLHVRDPFLALQNALRLTRQTVIVTDVMPRAYLFLKLVRPVTGDYMRFVPKCTTRTPWETWWGLSPEVITRFIGVLGFEKVAMKFHTQRFCDGRRVRFFTVIGHRTR